MKKENKKTKKFNNLSYPIWAGIIIVILVVSSIVVLGLLGISIMERRWESARPIMFIKPISKWEPDNKVWGENYPREYESYAKTANSTTKTKYGGSFPRDYLEDDPRQVILFAGYGFSKEYLQARGHYNALEDVTTTKRLEYPYNAGSCMTCKSSDVPRLMDEMGVKEFYAANFHDLKKEVKNSIGCQDCHDPETMRLQITRPALKEGLASMGVDINKVSYQEKRSLVCAQCHVEYYFKKEPKNYLTLPWQKGVTVEDMIQYYDENGFYDYINAISKTPIVKAQHPDYELFTTGIHAYVGLSCADCHMPYVSQGGMKFTDHHVQSPLLNIANSCAVCHRWGEDEIRARVESIQTKVENVMLEVEDALVRAHFDIAAALEAKVKDEELVDARKLLRHAQFRWDYISASNGMGFHSPQESIRILANSLNGAQEVRLIVTRLLAQKGISAEPKYPNIETRDKAWNTVESFIKGDPDNLL